MTTQERHLQDDFYWFIIEDQEETYQSEIKVGECNRG